MKRTLLIMILSCFTAVGFAQTTYYWVGGTAEGNIGTSAKWNTQQNGGGTPRATVLANDILIIDGSNIGGVTPVQGTVLINLNTSTTAQVKIINGASVILARTTASNGTLTIANVISGEAGLTIDATSSLQLNSLGPTYLGNVYIDLPSPATANIAGDLKFIQGSSTVAAASPRITCRTVGGLVFASGASFDYDNTLNYPFGTFGSAASNSTNGAIVFQAGADLISHSAYTPFGTGSTNFLIDFKSGSNFYVRKTFTSGIATNGRTFGNLFIQNGASLTNDASSLNKIENLTIDAGSSLNLNTTSSVVLPVIGNVVVNGTINGAPITTIGMTLLMGGENLQTISGNGTINLTNFTVADHANVKLEKSINVTGTANVYGTLDFSTFKIEGDGSFVSRVNYESASGSSYSNVATVLTAGSYQITVPGTANLSGLPGLEITGPGIPANTNIVSYASSAGQINLSKPVTVSSVGSTIGFKSNVSTLTTNSPEGFSANGSIALTGSITNNAGTNYVFNGVTTTPFGISGNAFGDVTFNATATTNRNVTVNGKLILNNVKLKVREVDILTLTSAGLNASSFNASSHIVISTAGANVGVVKVNDVTAATLIPVGTSTHYTPVTLNPTTASNFEVNVFAGTTADATPNGNSLTTAQKLKMVDATWNVQRTSGTGNVAVTLGWDNALEGADFSNFTNAQIGVAAYANDTYTAFSGSGNAAANTATLTTSTFTPFVVGEANTTLPLTLISFTPKESLNSVKLEWKTIDEVNLKNYVLQHKVGNNFQEIYTVPANNKLGTFSYGYTHLNPAAGVNYYRLVGVDLDGTTHTSDIKSVRVTLGTTVAIYPNPVSQRNITVSGVVKGDMIKILNIQGQVLATKAANGNHVEEIDIQNIQAGIYILSIENGGKVTSTKKVIKI